MKHKKIGKTEYNQDAVLEMGYESFKKAYGKSLGAELDAVWQELGGKIEKSKPPKNEVREA